MADTKTNHSHKAKLMQHQNLKEDRYLLCVVFSFLFDCIALLLAQLWQPLIENSFLFQRFLKQISLASTDAPLCPFCTLQSSGWYPRGWAPGCLQGQWPLAGPCCPYRFGMSLSLFRSWCWPLWWCIVHSSSPSRWGHLPERKPVVRKENNMWGTS